MAQFDTNNILGGVFNLGNSLLTSYYNVPLSTNVNPYLAELYSNQPDYQPSSMTGLMDLYSQTKLFAPLNAATLYNPTDKQRFAAYFGAGMNGYQAGKGLMDNFTNAINGTLNSTSKNNTSMLKETRQLQDKLNADLQNREEEQADIFYQTPTGDYAMWSLQPYQYWNGGGMISTGAGLLTGLLGIGLSAAGMKALERQAKADSMLYNNNLNYLNNKNQHYFNLAVNDTKNNMFNKLALLMMAQGGSLNTQGAEFPLSGNYNEIKTGGTHEQNPYSGVQQGVAPDGRPNLVEEGEVVWNNYVFSDSRRKDKKSKHPMPDLLIPQELVDKYKLNEKMTFADAAKELSKEAKERPNDYISNNGMDVMMSELRDAQELVKFEQQMKEIQKAVKKMSPEELATMLQLIMPQGQDLALPNISPVEELMVMQQSPMQQPSMEQQPIDQIPTDNSMLGMQGLGLQFAKGGHLYAGTDEPTLNLNYARAFNFLRQIPQLALLAYLTKVLGLTMNNTNPQPLDYMDLILNSGKSYDDLMNAYKTATTLNLMDLAGIDNIDDYVSSTGDSFSMDNFVNNFSTLLKNYNESLEPGKTKGFYKIDKNINAEEVEKNQDYRDMKAALYKAAFDKDMTDKDGNKISSDNNKYHFTKDLAKEIFKILDDRNKGDRKLLNAENKFTDDAEKTFTDLSFDDKGGIYHIFDKYNNNGIGTRTRYVNSNGEYVVAPEDLSLFNQTKIDPIVDEDGNITYRIRLTPNNIEGYDEPTSVELDKTAALPTASRYAPIIGSAIGALTSMAQPARDYSVNYMPRTATYEPIGDFLPYVPVDSQRYINASNLNLASALSNISNLSNANRNTALAQNALVSLNAANTLALQLVEIENINNARRQAVGEFNRGTNQYNSGQFGATSQYNASQYNSLIPNILSQNAQMRYAVDNERDNAIGTNLTTMFDNLGAIGTENFNMNMANSNPALFWGLLGNGLLDYKGNKKTNK